MDRGGVCIKFKENALGKDIQNGPEGKLGRYQRHRKQEGNNTLDENWDKQEYERQNVRKCRKFGKWEYGFAVQEI